MDIGQLYNSYSKHPSVQTDTRKLQPGDIFFALKGPSFNGNQFASKALELGASLAVIDEKEYAIPGKTILVDDVLTALQQLASHHRDQLHIPVIAITGSNGKTTTKELIHAVLSTTYNTCTTQGNLNNHIGVPLTLLRIKRDAQVAIVEMGANHLGEIAAYCKIAHPTHGLITNCGKAHLEGFGSVEGVRKAKGELFDYLRTVKDGTAFVMWDYDYLRQMSSGVPHIIRYGTVNADLTGRVRPGESFLSVDITGKTGEIHIQTNLVGAYNLPNVLAAAAIGSYMNIPLPVIQAAIENYHPSNSRSQLIHRGTNTIILDAYNANPTSMHLAIENMALLPSTNKVLLLGAMAELGAESVKEHAQLIQQIRQYQWNHVVLVGEAFKGYKDDYTYFDNADQTGAWLKAQHFKNCTILIKGSRSTQMEKVLSDLE